MFRTISGPPPQWESLLPPRLLRLPEELARVDALLDDPVFFAPYFHPVLGRPSTPIEWYLRLFQGEVISRHSHPGVVPNRAICVPGTRMA